MPTAALGGSDVPYDPEPLEPDYDPEYEIEKQTIEVRASSIVDGIRFIFTSFVNNFAGFAVVAVIFVAMMGVGVAEHAGMMAALIRKLVRWHPRPPDRLHPDLRRGSLQRRLRRRVPDPDPVVGRRLPHPGSTPSGRDGGGVRRCGRDFRRQPLDHARSTA